MRPSPGLDVALVTCQSLPEADLDAEPLEGALRRANLRAAWVPWDGPDGGESSFRNATIAVVRSTWNYFHDRPGFVAWAHRTAGLCRLFNPADVLATNTDKIYLQELQRLGIPIVPTAFVDPGSTADLGALMDAHGYDRVVVKPRVSAGSFRTDVHRRGELSGGELARAAQHGPVMVQPFVDSVDDYGERSLVWIDGVFTHAVRKSPRFSQGVERVDGVPIADDERAFAERVMDGASARGLLYGRVDLARDHDGRPMLMELELTEPSLQFRFCPEALERFVDGIARRVRETNNA
jgi:glutathione synthase/RimK-type ligase-like ATP-grasp enzyme